MRPRPHLRLRGGVWWCSLGHHAASGGTFWQAYKNWANQTI